MTFEVQENSLSMSAVSDMFQNLSEQIPHEDLSMQFLNTLFGPALQYIYHDAGPYSQNAIQNLFLFFNFAMFTSIALIVAYMSFSSIMNTARHGEFLGNERAVGSKAGYVLKPVFAALFTLPIAKIGYLSILQFMLLFLIVKSVAFANILYKNTLDFLKLNDSLIMRVETPPSAAPIIDSLKMSVCIKAVNMSTDNADNLAQAIIKDYELPSGGTATLVVADYRSNSSLYSSSNYAEALQHAVAHSQCGYQFLTCSRATAEANIKASTSERKAALIDEWLSKCEAVKNTIADMIYSNEVQTIAQIALNDDLTVTKEDINLISTSVKNAYANLQKAYASRIQHNQMTSTFADDFENMGWLSAGALYGEMSRRTYETLGDEVINVLHYEYNDRSSESFILREGGEKVQKLAVLVESFLPPLEKSKTIETENGTLVVREIDASEVVKRFKKINVTDAKNSESVLRDAVGTLLKDYTQMFQFALNKAYPDDPVRSLSLAGNAIINAGVALWIAKVSANVAAAAIDGVNDGYEESVAGRVAGFFGGGTITKTLSNIAITLLKEFAELLMIIAPSLIGVGVLLAFFLPMIPLIYWLFGVLGWMLMIIESMIAAPIWGLAHAVPDKENGWFGAHNIQGYQLLVNVMLRPILLVIGLIATIFVFYSISQLTITLFNVTLLSAQNDSSTQPLNVATFVIGAFLLGGLTIILAIKSQEAIYGIADAVMRWIGFGVSPLGEVKGGAENVKSGASVISNHTTQISSAALRSSAMKFNSKTLNKNNNK